MRKCSGWKRALAEEDGGADKRCRRAKVGDGGYLHMYSLIRVWVASLAFVSRLILQCARGLAVYSARVPL